MASARVLQPIASDPDARMVDRLAAMEARLTALEARRDLIITPYSVNNTTGVATTNFQSFGGQVWLINGGRIQSDTPTGAVCQLEIRVNNNLVAITWTNIAQLNWYSAIPLTANLVDRSDLVIGTNVLKFTNQGPTLASVPVGMIIEMPNARSS